MSDSTSAYIIDAIRTPFGRYGGALASVRAICLMYIGVGQGIAMIIERVNQ